jgi:hypothetical protein
MIIHSDDDDDDGGADQTNASVQVDGAERLRIAAEGHRLATSPERSQARGLHDALAWLHGGFVGGGPD